MRIRRVEIRHFRGIDNLEWCPASGINCIIGPGDSCKSSVLDALDYCLGARRSVQFTDADFHGLAVETPISVSVTIGELDDELKSFDAYGMYLRGYNVETEQVEDEPSIGLETVLTIQLTVAGDLEPNWSLYSERANEQDQSRDLRWSDRLRLAPARIGAMAGYHLGWRRGSVLNRVSDERIDASVALAKAARAARGAFGEEAQDQFAEALRIVAATAKELGVPIGEDIQALLDTHSVSLDGGTVSLHDESGVPLRGLGMGSARLLIAGLQRKASQRSSVILIDELEYGLEPHRIIRMLGSLGAKDTNPQLQVFMTTHSPVAVRELSGGQLFVMRRRARQYEARLVGTTDNVQSTVRLYPEAFLARSVLVCEGASEVGFVRGIDQHLSSISHDSISARGTALVDSGGGEADRPFSRGLAFLQLGYRVAVLRDGDKPVPAEALETFKSSGGNDFVWRERRTLEDELFLSLSNDAVERLIAAAVGLQGEQAVDDDIKAVTENATDLNDIHTDILMFGVSPTNREILGRASRRRRRGWFKSVTWMERISLDIVGPDLANADLGFRGIVQSIISWAIDESR